MNVVTNANEVFLQAVRVHGGAPGPIARGAAMMHLAMHDAVVAIVPGHDPYLPGLTASGTENVQAAVRHAAHGVLGHLYPAQQDIFDAVLATVENSIPATAAQLAGRALGDASAAAMIAHRTNDGSADNTPYVANMRPGSWRPAPGATAATPNWGNVTPFSLGGLSPAAWRATFRPPLPAGATNVPDLLRSAAYTDQFNEVKSLGRDNSGTRTPDQTEIAHFWANDLDGTSKPPGQLFAMAKTVAVDAALSVPRTARLFALVAVAMADAAVVAWDSKYNTELDLWRPDNAIQQAFLDDNKDTEADPYWLPLSVTYGGARFSPPFPAYVSGHATFAAAHGRMMANYFGTDTRTFTVTTEDPFAIGTPRQYTSFSAAAVENARSRVYLGVHYQWDADMGNTAGTQVADHAFANLLN